MLPHRIDRLLRETLAVASVRGRRWLVPTAARRRLALAAGGALLLTALGLVAAGGEETRYLTAPVEHGDVQAVITATGRLEAVEKVEVASQLSGQIVEVLADFNDAVRRGQPLARLDPATFAARVREEEARIEVARATVKVQTAAVGQAETVAAGERQAVAGLAARLVALRVELEQAGADLARGERLLKDGAVATGEVERARRARDVAAARLKAAEADARGEEEKLRGAEVGVSMAVARLANAQAVVAERDAALDAARADLERAVLRAPIDGVVVSRTVSPGQTVASSLEAKTLFLLARSLDRLRLEVFVDEADIGRVALGRRVTFTTDAYPDRTFGGVVDQIRRTPVVADNVTSFVVTAAIDNADLALFPGMTALARIVVAEARDALQVPNAALRFVPPSPPPGGAPGTAYGGPAGGGVTLPIGATAASPGSPATVWMADRRGVPVPVPVTLGVRGDLTTAILSGAVYEGQQLIVGVAPEGSGP